MPTRVLALDGGGSWAMIEVMTLMDLYGSDARGHEVLGTSMWQSPIQVAPSFLGA